MFNSYLEMRVGVLTNGFHWFLLLLSLAIASLYLSLKGLSMVDYGYAIWYDLLNINETIETEGPLNRVRPGFERTDRAERERLFSGIVTAVNNNGEGLGELVYHDREGRRLGPLLTRAEMIHLKDVARLLSRFRVAGLFSAGLFLVLGVAAMQRRLTPPSRYRIAIGLLSVLGGAGGALLLAGPVNVFYALHEIVFPSNHQWFFYYNESLMSMMMQAPNLFGPVALVWLIIAMMLVIIGWRLLVAGLRNRAKGD